MLANRLQAFFVAFTRGGVALAIVLTTAPAPALAQSATTRGGMEAYNRGDIASAFRLLRREAEAGDPEAQVNLGYLYARGQGVAQDQKAALDLYLRAAEHGSGEGMNAAGYKYEHATGVPRDLEKAVKWYCAGVLDGNPRAMNNLAILLHDGVGVARDEDDARALWRRAAEEGHANAMANLAFALFAYPGEESEGLEWLRRAAFAGHARAQQALRARGYQGLLPSPRDEAALMIPHVHRPPGQAKICGGLVS